jgi:peptide deformylase
MFETLENQGERIGLAAPQVFQSVQCVIYRIPKKTHGRYKTLCEEVPFTVMINPFWQPLNDFKIDGYEACISIPGFMGIVPRYKDISLTYETLAGEKVTKTVHDFHARVIQHECDHLIGKVFIEQMSDLSTLGFEDVILNQQHIPLEDVA